jgi:hypothetical protein
MPNWLRYWFPITFISSHKIQMSSDHYSLEKTLLTLPPPPPYFPALPAAHLTKAKAFNEIVKARRIEPQPDSHFNEKLIYFFYGGIFYRPASVNLAEEMELPVAFVFKPTALNSFARYYPFDTGAIFNGFFTDWRAKMGMFEETFKVHGTDFKAASLLVYHLFKTNRNYLKGLPDDELKSKPEPLPLLFEFLAANPTDGKTDNRQYAIECQATVPVPLDQQLLWVGYPDYYSREFSELYKILYPNPPKSYKYEYTRVFNPRDIAVELQKEAEKAVIVDYLNSPEITDR